MMKALAIFLFAIACAARQVLLRWGKPPHLVRADKAHLALALADGKFTVYAIDTSGERVREVQSRIHRGRLRFTADVAADTENATFLYEVVRSR